MCTLDNSLDHKSLKIANLIADNTASIQPQRPNFCRIEKSAFFDQLSQFVPKFQADTDDLLNDEQRLKEAQLEEMIMDPVKLEDVIMPA